MLPSSVKEMSLSEKRRFSEHSPIGSLPAETACSTVLLATVVRELTLSGQLASVIKEFRVDALIQELARPLLAFVGPLKTMSPSPVSSKTVEAIIPLLSE